MAQQTQHHQQPPAPPPVLTEGHVPGPLAALALPDGVRRSEERRARFWGWVDTFSTRGVPDDVPTERVYVYFTRCHERETEILRWAAEAEHQVHLAIAALGPRSAPVEPEAGVADQPLTTADPDAVRWAQDLRAQRAALADHHRRTAEAEHNGRVLLRLQADLLHIARAAEAGVHANIAHAHRLVSLYTRARRGLFSRNTPRVAALPTYPRYTTTFSTFTKGSDDVA